MVAGSNPVPRSNVFEELGKQSREIFWMLGGGNSTVEPHSSKVMVAARLQQAGFKSRPPLQSF